MGNRLGKEEAKAANKKAEQGGGLDNSRVLAQSAARHRRVVTALDGRLIVAGLTNNRQSSLLNIGLSTGFGIGSDLLKRVFCSE